MGVLENWYINLTNCLHGAARLFPDLLCSCAAWAFSKTLFLSAPHAHSAPPSQLSPNHFLTICTALVRRLLSLCSQRLTRLLSNYLAFFDFRPEMVPPLDFLFILPVPSLSRRRPLKQKIKYYHSLKTFHNGARFWPKKYFGVIFVSGLHCKSRIIGQMSVCKCPLVTFSTPLSHDPSGWTRQDTQKHPKI